MNISKKIRQSDIDKIFVRSQLEQQIQTHETKDSGWRFDKNISVTKFFYETAEMIVSTFVKFPLRSASILTIKNDDEYCFLWWILVHLNPTEDVKKGHPTRVSNYRGYLDELNIRGFNFTIGLKFSDLH